MQYEELTGRIIRYAMNVYDALGAGFLESVYQKALAHEMKKHGLCVYCEQPLTVRYDGIVVGEFIADMIVEAKVIIENKAVRSLAPQHEVQLVNYLVATGVDVGLLLNFGGEKFEVKRKSREYRPPVARSPVPS